LKRFPPDANIIFAALKSLHLVNSFFNLLKYNAWQKILITFFEFALGN
jgi:hypothetical protein